MRNDHASQDANPGEEAIRRYLFGACARARDALTRCPSVGPLAGPIAVASAAEHLEMMLEALAEAEQYTAALLALDDVSKEGVRIAGATEFALGLLRTAAGDIAARIDNYV